MSDPSPEEVARYARWVVSHRKLQSIVCEFCGKSAEVRASMKEPPRYCSVNCRVKAWQHRQRAAQRQEPPVVEANGEDNNTA
jgi:hypothetical protein